MGLKCFENVWRRKNYTSYERYNDSYVYGDYNYGGNAYALVNCCKLLGLFEGVFKTKSSYKRGNLGSWTWALLKIIFKWKNQQRVRNLYLSFTKNQQHVTITKK